MNQKIQQGVTAPNRQDSEKSLFSKEELQVLSDAIKKSKTRVSETKAASCAYHRWTEPEKARKDILAFSLFG